MITLYTITYNEELLIKFMIDHYRTRFPGCRIVVYDNISSDNTVKIAKENGCEVIPYDTNNQLQDLTYIKIKNNCWKNALTDWVLICDLDELLDINKAQLEEEERLGTSIVRARGYNMVNTTDNLDIAKMHYGERDSGNDKSYLFNKKLINEINYEIGCHNCDPRGSIRYSKKAYKLYHYCYLNYHVSVRRFRVFSQRMSPENIAGGWGNYSLTRKEIRALYTEAWKHKVKVR